MPPCQSEVAKRKSNERLDVAIGTSGSSAAVDSTGSPRGDSDHRGGAWKTNEIC
jgi:hypothetical protein